MRWQKIKEDEYMFVWCKMGSKKDKKLHGRDFAIVKSATSGDAGKPSIMLRSKWFPVPNELLGKRVQLFLKIRQ